MLEIRYEPLDSLAPYEKNARTHSKSQIKQIEASLERFGWTTPVAVADGTLVYGHARRQAAINLRDKGRPIARNPDPARAPVVDLSALTPDERRAYAIADNSLALAAGWDDDILHAEMRELSAASFDMTLLGFSKDELAEMLVEPTGYEPSGSLLALVNVTIAEPRHTVEAHDHWTLDGRHHLICASVIEGWPEWRPLLTKGTLFVPYPGPFVPFGTRAAECALIMVQPDGYLAGHILDRFAEVRGEASVVKLPPVESTPPKSRRQGR